MNAEAARGGDKRDFWTDAQPAQSQAHAAATSTIDEALTITGRLTSGGNLRVNGSVVGTIHCHSLVLGEKSHVEGDVIAAKVVIHGHFIGSVHAPAIVLCGGCHVEADLYHQSLTIEPGVHFEGQSSREVSPPREEQSAEPEEPPTGSK
jgi:cytoskeletal protein CcmA (bactofilin family)